MRGHVTEAVATLLGEMLAGCPKTPNLLFDQRSVFEIANDPSIASVLVKISTFE